MFSAVINLYLFVCYSLLNPVKYCLGKTFADLMTEKFLLNIHVCPGLSASLPNVSVTEDFMFPWAFFCL